MNAEEWRAAIERCTDKGVTERPPMPGFTYRAFVVHPVNDGPLAFAIAHRDGDTAVVDMVRDNFTVRNLVPILKRYGIDRVTGDVEWGDGLTMAQATLGVVGLVMKVAT